MHRYRKYPITVASLFKFRKQLPLGNNNFHAFMSLALSLQANIKINPQHNACLPRLHHQCILSDNTVHSMCTYLYLLTYYEPQPIRK